MNKLTNITKLDIYEIFRDGIIETDQFLDIENTKRYVYYGRLEEIDFLKQLYPLESMPSLDSRYKNAEGDIVQHTIHNDDWDYCWVFKDDRFGLINGDDATFLRFLCKIFHPEVRDEKGCWRIFYDKVNALLRADGYELYELEKISNRPVYTWRRLADIEVKKNRFVPFSQRYAKELRNKTISLTISQKARGNIVFLFAKYSESFCETTETGWRYTVSTEQKVMRDIEQFYIPHCFNEQKKYVLSENIADFVKENYPFYVLDAVELYGKYCEENFAEEINQIFEDDSIAYSLIDGKFEKKGKKIEIQCTVKEIGLSELLGQALELFNDKTNNTKQLAVEKLWDAFERLKTYYKNLKKQESVSKIIDKISHSNNSFISLYDEEFRTLTTIGNDYRIRHHETNKIDIIDDKYYEYFFKRCIALIELALEYLQ